MRRVWLAGVLSSLLTINYCHAGFVNGGFEAAPFPTYGPWDATGGNASIRPGTYATQITPSAIVNNFVNVHSGNYAIYASVIRDSYAELAQSMPVTPGVTYEVGFYQCIGTGTDPGPVLYDDHIVINGVSNRFLGAFTWGGVPGNFQYISTTFTPGAGVNTATIAFQLSTSHWGSYVGVSYDDFTITALPEPGAVILLGAAGLVLLGRRR